MMFCAEKILTVIAHCLNKRQLLVIWCSGLPKSLKIETVDGLGLKEPH